VTAEKKVATVDRLSLDNEIKLCHIDVWRRSLGEISALEEEGGDLVVYQVICPVFLSESNIRHTCLL
jgi:hypothetical protein